MKKNGIALIILSVVICLLACLFTACGTTINLGTDITITFMVDGEVYHEMEVKNDKTVRMPAEPEKDGYVFAGWYLSEDYEEVFTSSYLRNNTVVSDITVYAKWVTDDNQPPQGTFTIHFNSMGGSEVADIVLSEGATFVLPDDPTKTGYTFAGWYLDESYQTIFESTSQLIDGIVLYAKWVEEHEHSYTTITFDPDCENDGYTRHSCECGYYYDDEIVPATGHTPSEWIVDTEPNCLDAGSKHKECTVCNNTIETEVIPATGHTWAWIVDKNATVTESGLKHEECSVCHAKQNENTTIDPLDCSHEGTLIHHTKVDATCTEDGTIEYWHCTACDKKYTDATGQIIAETIVIPSTGHTGGKAVQENVVAATCTTAGSYDSVVYCSVCDAELSRETKSIDALDHNIVNHNAQTPTCTEVGWEAYETCSRCDYTTYVEIPATGHDYEAKVTEPTCTEQGYTTHTCHCGDSYVDTYVDANGHTWGNWYETKAPTDTEAGEERRDCETCDCYETNVLPALVISGIINNFTWTLNRVTGELVISGIGTVWSGWSAGWHDYRSIIKSVTIEDGMTAIGEEAFSGYTSLKSVVIPDSVTIIGEDAFSHCRSLTSVTIGDSVTTIGDYAFCDCSSLTSIVIPEGVTTIGYSAFNSCTSLTSVTIGDSVTTIGECAFYECTSLTSIVIPDSVTSIGEWAFAYCYSLTSVTIGDSVTTIGDYAFCDCSSLTSVTFGENSQLTTIGYSAFAYCYSLTSVTIGDSVTAIGDDAFCCCYALAEVYNYSSLNITKGSEEYGYVAYYALDVYTTNEPSKLTTDDNGFVIHSNGNLVKYFGTATEITIPDSVTIIGEGAFSHCDSLTSVTFGENSQLTTIGLVAFYNCDSLTSIVIPEGVTTIGECAFSCCTNLTSVTFGADSQLTTIGYGAFEYCDSLTSIVIPDSVTSIGEEAFYYCDSLTSITVDENNPNYKSIDGNLYSKDGQTLIQYAIGKTATSFVIPDSVTTIGNYAFYYCDSLTSITIPDSVTTIGWYAFTYCDSLTSIVIPDSVTTISNLAFSSCYSLTSVTIGDSVATIGESAFYCCYKLVEVYNKSSLNIVAGSYGYGNVGYYALNVYTEEGGSKISTDEDGFIIYTDGADKILVGYTGTETDLIIPDGIKEIYKYACWDCSSLTSIVIPDSVTTIGDYAFAYCTSLTSIIIPDSVTTIGDYAFAYCTSLTSIIIPDSVTTIGYGAFQGCTSLTSIVIPDSVTTIGRYAFSSCTSLTDVYYTGTEEQWNSISIGSYNDPLTNATIHYNYVNE